MISPSAVKFKYIDRKKASPCVLIPGWASDCRIFETIDLDFNYILPESFDPWNFEKDLHSELKNKKISRVSLFGWSLGGFLAADFASKHPEKVDRLILVSIRRKYDPGRIEEIKKLLRKNKKAYLASFYRQSFTRGEDASWFKSTLFDEYCAGIGLERLVTTLDLLAGCEIRLEGLKGLNPGSITIIHGEEDLIAPVGEAEAIAKELNGAEFIKIRSSGHMPFLNKGFKTYYGG